MGDGSDIMKMGALGGLSSLRDAQLQTLKSKTEQTTQLKKSEGLGGREEASKRVAHKQTSVEAATQFEALLLHQMLQTMWSTLPKEGLLSGSREEGLYRDMLNEAVAKSISENQSIGIRDVIARDIDKLQK